MAFPRTRGMETMIQDCVTNGIHFHPWRGHIELVFLRFARSLFLKFLSLLPSTYHLLKIMRAVRPDVIQITHAALYETPAFALVGGYLNIPTLVVFQSVFSDVSRKRFMSTLYRWARVRNQRWVAVSEQNRKRICETFSISPDHVQLIPNGIELNTELSDCSSEQVEQMRREVRIEFGIPANAKILLTVGRLTKDKGFFDLLEVVPPLVREFPEVRFLWMGDGEARGTLERMARQYAVDKHVIVCGYRTDIPRLLCAADLLVVASHNEGGCSSAVREAMVHRLPIVASDAGGIPEVLEDRVHALLFPVGNREGMLESVRWALEHPERMDEMALKARERIEHFSAERMTTSYLQTLEELHSKRRIQT